MFLEVPTYRVYDNLIHLNKRKAPGLDDLPNWMHKGYAKLLAEPVIFYQQCMFYKSNLSFKNPVFLEVPTYQLYDNLIHLNKRKANKRKAPGLDGLPNWVLKKYAELLAQPANIQKLPSIWKHADIVPLPKSQTPRKSSDQFP